MHVHIKFNLSVDILLELLKSDERPFLGSEKVLFSADKKMPWRCFPLELCCQTCSAPDRPVLEQELMLLKVYISFSIKSVYWNISTDKYHKKMEFI